MMDETTETVREGPATDPIAGALRELAAREEAPKELDLLLEPLRLSEPHPPLVRPAFRWAAAAAALAALGFWLPGMFRDTAAPSFPAASGSGTGSGYFRLHPLPAGEERGDAGAVDHLLREPPPDPAEAVGTPVPLEIMGPAEEPPAGAGALRPWTLEVAGRRVRVEIPKSVARGPLHVELTIVRGRITSGTTGDGAPLPVPVLQALAGVKLDPALAGRFPASLTPRRSSAGSSGR